MSSTIMREIVRRKKRPPLKHKVDVACFCATGPLLPNQTLYIPLANQIKVVRLVGSAYNGFSRACVEPAHSLQATVQT